MLQKFTQAALTGPKSVFFAEKLRFRFEKL